MILLSFSRMEEPVVQDLEMFLSNVRRLNRNDIEWTYLKNFSNIPFLYDLMVGIGGEDVIIGEGINWPLFRKLVETLLATRD